MNYDVNGNITGLQRTGLGAGVMDQLGYTYDQSGNSNKLIRVNDASGNAAGYPVGGNTIVYDINGNMVNHLDKGISNIAYNYLNLPSSITASIGNTDYVYRADGSKVKKVFGGKTTDYLDGFQYEDGVLQFVPTSEGYYDLTKNKYIYNYTDHLGNVRLSYTKGASGGAEIIEENNYYPFGLKHQGYNSNSLASNAYQYKYNGKELQETGMYDYGARMYMPELGRWGAEDPKSEFGRRWSPYTYAFDNPIRFIDPDGMWPWPTWNQIKTLASTYYSGMYQGAKGSLKGTYHGVKQLVTNPIGTVKSAAKAIINDPKGVMKSMQGRYTDPFTLMALGIGSVATGDASAAGKYVGNTYTNMATDAAAMVATEGVGNIARGLVSKVGKASAVAETESALSGGAMRAAKFSEGWENASLSDAINKFAPDAEGVANASGKTIYNNSETGIQVVYDNNGNYFRVENTNLSGKRNYLDMDGNVPNNKTINGKQAGRNNAEYNQVTHFNNID
ncbi:hypothetical protein BAY05_08840 [Elizabethkingia anophelis]|nr:hypothetical protein BAY05_08840 [Elizabethkingia anophelis]